MSDERQRSDGRQPIQSRQGEAQALRAKPPTRTNVVRVRSAPGERGRSALGTRSAGNPSEPREPHVPRQSVEAALERYVSQRLAALRSLDSETISSWLRAYGMHWPSGRDFWIRVHRMRTWPLVGLSEAERARSRRWLDGVARELGAYLWDERLAARLERVPETDGSISIGTHCTGVLLEMDINDYLGGDHLRREDVPKPMLVTVAEVTVKEFDNPPEKKAVLHFAETERSLVANKTNLKIAKSVFGTSETDDWKGKQIVVYDDPNIFFAGKQTGGLRLRAPKPPEAPQEDVPF